MEKSVKMRWAAAYIAALALMMMTGPGSALAAKSGETRLRTDLTGGAIAGKTPHGHAEFRSQTGRNRSQFNVEVENVNLADGTSLEVDVNGAKVGTLTLKLGEGELELNSQDGEVVPAVQKGDVVTVVSTVGAILSGAF